MAAFRALLATSVLAAGIGSASGSHGAVLGPRAIGAVRFGTAKPAAVAALTRLLGTPSWRGPNTGCSPRYTEVEWGDLAVEFRSGRLSGWRYLAGGLTSPTGKPYAAATSATPRLATAKDVTLGTLLTRVRTDYGTLKLVGTSRWQAPNGLVFRDDAKTSASRHRRVVEIKVGVCGDF